MPLISLYSIWECLHPFNPVPPQKVMAAKRTLILLFFLWQPLVLFNTHNSNTHQWLTSQLFYNCEELSPLFVYAHRIRSSFVLLFNFYFASTLHLPSSTASYCRPGRQRFRCLAEVVLFGLRPVGPTVGVLSRWSERSFTFLLPGDGHVRYPDTLHFGSHANSLWLTSCR